MSTHDRRTAKRPAPADLVAMFVVRGRRIAAHSLARELETLKTNGLEWRFQAHSDGRVTMHRDLPDEERFESFAARIRPLTLKSEPLWYPNVIEAISALVTAGGRFLESAQAQEFSTLKEAWSAWDIENLGMRGYSVQLSGPSHEEVITATDGVLGAGWFYADVAHADPKHGKEVALEYGLDERYAAAVHVFTGLALVVLRTLDFVTRLSRDGCISFPEWAWSSEVVAKTGEVVQETTAFFAPAGTPMPSIGETRGPEWQTVSYESAEALLGIFHLTARLLDAERNVLATHSVTTSKRWEQHRVVGLDLNLGAVLDIHLPRPDDPAGQSAFEFRSPETNQQLVDILTLQRELAASRWIEIDDDKDALVMRLGLGGDLGEFTIHDGVLLEASKDLAEIENRTGQPVPVIRSLPSVETLVQRRILRLVLSGSLTYATGSQLTVTTPDGVVPAAVQIPAQSELVDSVSIPVPAMLLWHPDLLAEPLRPDPSSTERVFLVSVPRGQRFLIWAPETQSGDFDPRGATPTDWGLDHLFGHSPADSA